MQKITIDGSEHSSFDNGSRVHLAGHFTVRYPDGSERRFEEEEGATTSGDPVCVNMMEDVALYIVRDCNGFDHHDDDTCGEMQERLLNKLLGLEDGTSIVLSYRKVQLMDAEEDFEALLDSIKKERVSSPVVIVSYSPCSGATIIRERWSDGERLVSDKQDLFDYLIEQDGPHSWTFGSNDCDICQVVDEDDDPLKVWVFDDAAQAIDKFNSFP